MSVTLPPYSAEDRKCEDAFTKLFDIVFAETDFTWLVGVSRQKGVNDSRIKAPCLIIAASVVGKAFIGTQVKKVRVLFELQTQITAAADKGASIHRQRIGTIEDQLLAYSYQTKVLRRGDLMDLVAELNALAIPNLNVIGVVVAGQPENRVINDKWIWGRTLEVVCEWVNQS